MTYCSRRAGCIAACTTCSSAPSMLSGFTIVRNAVSLDYPIVPALRSILEICDEVIVNEGQSAEGTRDLVTAMDNWRAGQAESEENVTRCRIVRVAVSWTDGAARTC